MDKYFLDRGFFGEVNKALLPEHAYKVGHFLGWYFKEEKRHNRGLLKQKSDFISAKENNKRIEYYNFNYFNNIRVNDKNFVINEYDKKEIFYSVKILIGNDGRNSKKILENMLIGGITASGATVYNMGMTSIASISYITSLEKFDCGIMLSGGCYKSKYNSIRLFNNNNQRIAIDILDMIEDYIDGSFYAFERTWKDIPCVSKNKIGCVFNYIEGKKKYIDYLVSMEKYSLNGEKIAIDCANGCLSYIAPKVFEKLGAKISVINDNPTGFNINKNCGPSKFNILKEYVLKHDIDIGFAFNGDGSKCICIERGGKIINGDNIMYIYSCYRHNNGDFMTNTVVATSISGFGLFKALDDAGIFYIKTDPGDVNIYKVLRKNGCIIGGNRMGHIIFKEYFPIGDGIFTSLKMLEIMIEKHKALSELSKNMHTYNRIAVKINVKDTDYIYDNGKVQDRINEIVNLLKDNGRIFIPKPEKHDIYIIIDYDNTKLSRKYIDSIIDIMKEEKYYIEHEEIRTF